MHSVLLIVFSWFLDWHGNLVSDYTIYAPQRGIMAVKSLSYTGPSLWTNLNENLKRSSSINDFKHKIKEFYFEELKKNMNLNKRP